MTAFKKPSYEPHDFPSSSFLDTIDMLGVMESTTNGQPYPCNYTPLFWAPFFVNETISFLMISYKAWEDRRTDGPCRKGIASTVVTHNIIYYFM